MLTSLHIQDFFFFFDIPACMYICTAYQKKKKKICKNMDFLLKVCKTIGRERFYYQIEYEH